jgi:methylenetetrahydrofolate reductase (NADPH)
MDADGIQLEMFFEEHGNRFRERLENGVFSILIEVPTPSRNTDFNTAVSQYLDFEFAAGKFEDIPVSLAVTDKLESNDSWNVADFASALIKTDRDKHLIYISGKNASLGEMRETLSLCGASGFQNIVPVSGDISEGVEGKPARYTEGIHLNKIIQLQDKGGFYGGCAANPFKYTPKDIYPQYFKLMKKFNHGAEFVVTQAGWDMMKLQEFRWHLSARGAHYPSIARLLLLTPELVKVISNGRAPGIHISPDFKKILETEIKYSLKQFEAAQWRRLQIQAAGARFLGYSGIQIAGLISADQAKIACRRVKEALNEFDCFEDWKEAYHEHLARAEMAPYPHRFYMYNNLFRHAHLDFTPVMNDGDLPTSPIFEKLKCSFSEFLFSHSHKEPADEHLITKKLFAGCRGCSYCRLPLTQYICPELCPKGLANGPCGGTKADGLCEESDRECIHSRIMRLATWRNKIDQLEDQYIECAEKEGT